MIGISYIQCIYFLRYSTDLDLNPKYNGMFLLYFRTSTIIYRFTLKKALIFLKDMDTSSATDASLKWNMLANSGM